LKTDRESLIRSVYGGECQTADAENGNLDVIRPTASKQLRIISWTVLL